MTERITLARDAETECFDFSETALAGVERLNLDVMATEEVVDAAQKEVVKRAKTLEFECNVPFHVALRRVIETSPRLFRLSRLEKTRSLSAATVVGG